MSEPGAWRSFKSAQFSMRQPTTSDSSLALPAEENMAVPWEKAPDRNARVQEQVRLTLARKKRNAISNGNIYSQDTTSDSGKILQYSMMAQSPLHLGSMGMYSLKRLPHRGELSPKSSPVLSHRTLFGSQNSGTGCQGAYTLPAARNFKHYTHSEMLRSQGVQAPPQTNQNKGSLHRSYRKQRFLPGQQQVGSLTAGRRKGKDQGNRQDSCAASFASMELDSRVEQTGSMKAAAKLEKQNGQQQAGSLSLLTAGQGKGKDQGNRQDSCVASFASMELDSRVGQTGSMKAAAKLEKQNGQQQAGSLSLLTAGRGKGKDQGNRQDFCTTSFASNELDSWVKQTVNMKAAAKLENQNGVRVMNGRKEEGHISALTLERAVKQLSSTNPDLQVSSACYIQHQCFVNPRCKKRLLRFGGIRMLLQVLGSDNEELQKASISALRNAVYGEDENKKEVQDQNGIITLLNLLSSTRDIETRVQLTGLLWNLSSHDCLKDQICKEGLEILTESVIIPCSGIAEGDNPKDDLLVHPEIFYNATGCLRNLSSNGPHTRTDMRNCNDLIDALVHYVQRTIADHKADDKSTENCVCILHNLSFQMDAEELQGRPTPQQHPAPVVKVAGCFGSRSKEIAQVTSLPSQEEKIKEANPQGKEWLSSYPAARMYLSLMARSNRKGTLEAAIGALLNATSGIGMKQKVMAQAIVRTEKSLPNLKRMLYNQEYDVRTVALSLLNNISRHHELHDELVSQVLRELINMLPVQSSEEMPIEITLLLCRILTNLSQYEIKHAEAIINHGGLARIMNIKGISSPKVCEAVSPLLQAMWQHKDLRPSYINAGYRKGDFIKSRTKKAASFAGNTEEPNMNWRLPKRPPPSGSGKPSS
ncbi:plakophilin-2 isoform X3 [Brienomyrus brachyistius]|uniref:plakophilin-2 isoform X3 n=1 Tax=Brienomyrus brachyistius TaxID=42636 RepID=UPI0020B17D3C|nr:plakophilin-2 isoform X3 [Brienomyrus brachyistius]